MYFCSEKVARFGCDSNQYCKTSLDNLEMKDAITINAAPRKRPIKGTVMVQKCNLFSFAVSNDGKYLTTIESR